MGEWSGSKDEESLKALQLAVDLGCNFFDSAWAYGNGKSDGLLGQIIGRNKGKRLYAASRIPPKNDKWPASQAVALAVSVRPGAIEKVATQIDSQLQRLERL